MTKILAIAIAIPYFVVGCGGTDGPPITVSQQEGHAAPSDPERDLDASSATKDEVEAVQREINKREILAKQAESTRRLLDLGDRVQSALQRSIDQSRKIVEFAENRAKIAGEREQRAKERFGDLDLETQREIVRSSQKNPVDRGTEEQKFLDKWTIVIYGDHPDAIKERSDHAGKMIELSKYANSAAGEHARLASESLDLARGQVEHGRDQVRSIAEVERHLQRSDAFAVIASQTGTVDSVPDGIDDADGTLKKLIDDCIEARDRVRRIEADLLRE
ncbi:MAG: hypothetical protein WD066_08050 [Planctomycetaceae bacterium]